jgi:cell division protein FtsB
MSNFNTSLMSLITQQTAKLVDRIKQLEATNQKLEAENNALKAQLSTDKYNELKTQYDNLSERHKEIKQAFNEAEFENNNLTQELKTLKNEYEKLKNQQEMTNKQVEEHFNSTFNSLFNSNQSNVVSPASPKVSNTPKVPENQKKLHSQAKRNITLVNKYQSDSENDSSTEEYETDEDSGDNELEALKMLLNEGLNQAEKQSKTNTNKRFTPYQRVKHPKPSVNNKNNSTQTMVNNNPFRFINTNVQPQPNVTNSNKPNADEAKLVQAILESLFRTK